MCVYIYIYIYIYLNKIKYHEYVKSCFSFKLDRVNLEYRLRFTNLVLRLAGSVPSLCLYRIWYWNRCDHLRGGWDLG